MSLQPSHPDDLEVIADQITDAFEELTNEDSEERLMNEKINAESEANIEDDEVKRMMTETFDKEESKPLKLVLFKEDGDYGYITFSGIFENLDFVISCLSKEGREIVVADDGEGTIEGNANLDFYLLDVTAEPVEILYGVKLVQDNYLVTA